MPQAKMTVGGCPKRNDSGGDAQRRDRSMRRKLEGLRHEQWKEKPPNMNARDCDPEWYSRGEMTQNTGRWWLKVFEWVYTMVSNTECRLKMWLWTPNQKWTKALNVKLGSDDDGSECWYWWMWLWTSNWVITMALNAERRCADDSKRQTRKWWWLWSPKQRMQQWWLWTPKLRSDNDGSECRTKMWWWLWKPILMNVTMNVKLRSDNDGSECQTEKWWWLWTPKLRSGDGSKRRMETADGSERQDWEVMMMAPILRIVMAPNAKTEKRWWLWTPNWK